MSSRKGLSRWGLLEALRGPWVLWARVAGSEPVWGVKDFRSPIPLHCTTLRSEHPGNEGNNPRAFLWLATGVRRMFSDMHERVEAEDDRGSPVDWHALDVPAVKGSDGVRFDWGGRAGQTFAEGVVARPHLGKPCCTRGGICLTVLCHAVANLPQVHRCCSPCRGSLDIYVGGFVCKDNSSANRKKRPAAVPGAELPGGPDPQGPSHLTFLWSLKVGRAVGRGLLVLPPSRSVVACPSDPSSSDLDGGPHQGHSHPPPLNICAAQAIRRDQPRRWCLENVKGVPVAASLQALRDGPAPQSTERRARGAERAQGRWNVD